MGVTLIVHGGVGVEERYFCLKKWLRAFSEIKFFCVTFLLYSAQNNHEDHFLRIFSKILRSGCGEG